MRGGSRGNRHNATGAGGSRRDARLCRPDLAGPHGRFSNHARHFNNYHILCRWFGPIREGGWGWAAAKQSLDLGPVGAGEGAGGRTGKAVNRVASEAVGKAVGERVDGRPGGWGVGRAACEGAGGGTGTMALRMVDPAWMWGYAIQPWQDLMAGS